jgi:hypothetical protein
MTIIKTPNGWLVEPSTKEELEHLRFLLDALKTVYGTACETNTPTSVPANQSPSLCESQSKAA